MVTLSGVGSCWWGWKIRVAIWCADSASHEVLGRAGLITRGRDGMHRDGSRHYLLDLDSYIVTQLLDAETPAERAVALTDPPGSHGAFDLRTWPALRVPGQILPAKRELYRAAIDRRLEEIFPGEFDVIAEATHIHVEHDPD